MAGEKQNFRHIHGNMYIVMTQAGFRKVLKANGWEKNIRLDGDKFPKSYPSVISIFWHGPGDSWLGVFSVPCRTIADAIADAIA